MTERPQTPEKPINMEDYPARRMRLASLRELPGNQEEALKEAGTLRERLHEEIVDLYWEEYLIGKHQVMEARDKSGLWSLPIKAKGIAEGFLRMRNSARRAQDYIDEHHVEAKRPRSGRFLGEVEMLLKRYPQATKHFRRSVQLFEKMDTWGQRVNALELSGFLAEALILSGKTQEGIDIAKQTFERYDEGDGAKLKENDYYTWAVWKSGCAIKAWHAVLAKGVRLTSLQEADLIQMLDKAELVLVIPKWVGETWGDRNFDYRRGEIKAIRAHKF